MLKLNREITSMRRATPPGKSLGGSTRTSIDVVVGTQLIDVTYFSLKTEIFYLQSDKNEL